MNFVVLDMEIDNKTPLILGWPFLSTVDANIDVGKGQVHLNINGRRETFAFKSKVEQCQQVKIFQNQAPKEAPEPKVDQGKPSHRSNEENLARWRSPSAQG